MKQLNNKGQSLVLFVLLLPILLLILGVVVNIGVASIAKRKVDINVKNMIKTSLNDIEESQSEEDIQNEINKLITINLGTVDRDILIEENQVQITVTKKIDSPFSFLLDNSNITYTVTYVGIIDNGEIQIVRRG